MKKTTPRIRCLNIETPSGSPVLSVPALSPDTADAIPDFLHYHDHLEIGYCHHDSGSMVYGDGKIPYGDDTLTVLPPGFPHATRSADTADRFWEYLYLDIGGFLDEVYEDQPSFGAHMLLAVNSQPYLFRAEEQPKIVSLLRRVFRIMQEQQGRYTKELREALSELVIQLARLSPFSPYGQVISPPPGPRALIAAALDYIDENPARPFTILDLANMCFISETHFRRLFVKCMHMMPLQYVNRARIRLACDRLKQTDEPVDKIIASSGFNSAASFLRNFRMITGTSPLQYRKHPERFEYEHMGRYYFLTY